MKIAKKFFKNQQRGVSIRFFQKNIGLLYTYYINTAMNQEAKSSPISFEHVKVSDQVENHSSTDGSASKKEKYEKQAFTFIQVQGQREIDLRVKLFNQCWAYLKAQQKFRANQLYSYNFIYLISKPWLQKWKKMVQYDRLASFEMPNWQLSELSSKQCINQDIVKKDQPTLKFGEGYEHYNVFLREFLEVDVDFQYLSPEMWEVFKSYNKIEVKREIFPEKKQVDLFLPTINLIVVSNRLLREAKEKSRQRVPRQLFQFSSHKSIKCFEEMVRNSLTYNLLNKHALNDQEIRYDLAAFKFHFLRQSASLHKILKRIRSSYTQQKLATQFTISLPYQEVENTQNLSEIFGEEPIVVCEILEKYEGDMFKICYNEKSYAYSSCWVCKKVTDLVQKCSCKNIAYCSENCRMRHLNHIKACAFPKKENFGIINKGSGLVGLENLGNTCFMNSGLQCLSNTIQLTEYFLEGHHLVDLELGQPSEGNLSKSYHKVISKLWEDSTIKFFIPQDFRKCISGFQDLFQGYQQNDAGEFLTYLMAGLHSQLNRSSNTFSFKQKDIDKRPEKVIADQQWRHFLMANESKIVELMYGQFRSQISCPNCNYKSLKFDPFMICELPIPQDKSKYSPKIQIIFQDEDNFREQRMFFICLEDCYLYEVGERLKRRKNLKANCQLMFYSNNQQISPNKSVHYLIFQIQEPVYVRILTQYEQHQGLNVFVKFRCIKEIINKTAQMETFMFKLYKFPKNMQASQIPLILYELNKELYDAGDSDQISFKNFKQSKISIKATPQFGPCFVCNQFCLGCKIPDRMSIRDILKKTKRISFQYTIRSKLLRPYQTSYKKSHHLTLMNCFNAFKETEILTDDNAWLCPQCKKLVRGQKQMMIYKSPKILIICLKRFKQLNDGVQKNDEFIRFPLTNLNLTNIVLDPEIPWTSSQSQVKTEMKNHEVLYDLYAVCYHQGVPENGHYTAICKNPLKNAWYRFDDKSVRLVQESSIVNEQAYLLFYRRKEKQGS